MTIVYLVTSGEYSNYSVNGAFSSEQLAQEFIEKFGEANIASWELDDRCQEEICSYWCALLDLATECFLEQKPRSELADPKTRVGSVGHRSYTCQAHPKGYIVSQSYVSQEHANKLCIEKKQEIQRERR